MKKVLMLAGLVVGISAGRCEKEIENLVNLKDNKNEYIKTQLKKMCNVNKTTYPLYAYANCVNSASGKMCGSKRGVARCDEHILIKIFGQCASDPTYRW